MNPTNPFRAELGGISQWLVDTFDIITAHIAGSWRIEHKDDNSHGVIHADALSLRAADPNNSAATGLVTALGAGQNTFAGDVVARNATGVESGIGRLATVNGRALLASEAVREGLLLGGVVNGSFLEQRIAGSPFTSGYELRYWLLPWDVNTAALRFGIISGRPTLMDGGTGSTAFDLGTSTRPVNNVNATTVTATNFVQETSTWTPVLAFGGASVGITYSVQSGHYTVLGDVVIATFRILLTSKGSSVGNSTIAGLPYASVNARENCVIDTPGAAMLGMTSTPFLVISSSTLFPSQSNATGRTQLTDANFTNTSDIRACIVYKK